MGQEKIMDTISIGATLIRVRCVPEVIAKSEIETPDSSFP